MEQVVQEIPIEELAAQIKFEHQLAEEGMRSSLTHALRAGELLSQAKKRMKHGSWLKWLNQECHVKMRSAQGYIHLYARVGSNPQRVAHLSLREALRLLAAESTRPGGTKTKRRPATSEPGKVGDGVTIKLRPEDVKLALHVWTAGFKALAMKAHPDTGGDNAQMQALNALRREIEKQFADAAPREAAAA